MADRIEWFDVTVASNIFTMVPVVTPLVFPFGEVVEINVKVPPGPAGNVGFYLMAGGSQFIPRTMGKFIIPDDDYFVWPQSNAINSGSWALAAYNTDLWPHLIQVGFHVNEVIAVPSASPSGLVSL